MKSLLPGLCALGMMLSASAAAAGPDVIFSEDSGSAQALRLRASLHALGASRFSNFPSVRQVAGHTFLYFSQLKTGVHGEGSIAVVAIRARDSSEWSFDTLFAPDGTPNPRLLRKVKELVAEGDTLVLREYLLAAGAEVQVRALRPARGGLRAWGPVEYVPEEAKYVRTAYDRQASWLVESSDLSGEWNPRTGPDGTRCGPIASQDRLQFSEAATARIGANRWLAVSREDSGSARKDRGLYQSESFDNGCVWSRPRRIGDGTQPNLARVVAADGSTRLLLCVGDRTPKGLTPELGIQCRASSDIAVAGPGRPVSWGPPRMVYVARASGDLGQPDSIQVGPDTIETFFYADRGLGTKTDILAVRYRLRDLVLP